MLKRFLSLILMSLMLNIAAFAQQKTNEQDLAEKVKSKITKLGTGTKSKVKVTLKDGSKLKGYISEIKNDSFILTNEKTGATSETSYLQVEQVKKSNLSKGTSTALGISLGVVLVVGVLYLLGKLTAGA